MLPAIAGRIVNTLRSRHKPQFRPPAVDSCIDGVVLSGVPPLRARRSIAKHVRAILSAASLPKRDRAAPKSQIRTRPPLALNQVGSVKAEESTRFRTRLLFGSLWIHRVAARYS